MAIARLEFALEFTIEHLVVNALADLRAGLQINPYDAFGEQMMVNLEVCQLANSTGATTSSKLFVFTLTRL